jgi:hypothetical protein
MLRREEQMASQFGKAGRGGKARAQRLKGELKAWPPALIDLLQATHITAPDADLLEALGAFVLRPETAPATRPQGRDGINLLSGINLPQQPHFTLPASVIEPDLHLLRRISGIGGAHFAAPPDSQDTLPLVPVHLLAVALRAMFAYPGTREEILTKAITAFRRRERDLRQKRPPAATTAADNCLAALKVLLVVGRLSDAVTARVKRCRNPRCAHYFFDKTAGTTKSYCREACRKRFKRLILATGKVSG